VAEDGTTIRPYREGDEPALVEVCLRTGAAGGDASGLLTDHDLISQIYLLPYLALEPELASVVVRGDAPPEGYVLGALDTRAFEAAAEERWWPAVRERYPLDAFGSHTLDALLVHLVHHRVVEPDDLLAEYPSHLHIDLLPPLQGGGWGRRLMDRLLAQLAERGSPGVHLGTSPSNTGALAFYEHLGFTRWGDHGGHSVTMVLRLAR
jgi:ribosomal protein S18 acetylase RimI-like enzyme